MVYFESHCSVKDRKNDNEFAVKRYKILRDENGFSIGSKQKYPDLKSLIEEHSSEYQFSVKESNFEKFSL